MAFKLKQTGILALTLAGVMLLAPACSGSGAAPAAPADTTTAAATTAAADTTVAADTTTAAAEKVHLKIGGVKPQDDDPQSAKDEFDYWTQIVTAQFPNIDFEFDRFAPGEDYRQQYDQQLMAGNAPNVGAYFPYVDIPTRMANGTIGDLTSYVNNWDLKKQGLVTTVFDQAISTADGKWYAVPGYPYVSGIVINTAVQKDGGGDPANQPTTWSAFATDAQSYTDKSVPRFGYLLLGSDWNAWTFTPWVWSAGGEMVRDNGDGTWKPAFAEDPGVDAAMFMHDLVWKYNCTQKDILEDYNAFTQHFLAGQAVYGWGSPPGFSADDLAKYDQKQEDIAFMPLPGKDDGGHQATFAGGEVFTVNPQNTPAQNDAAWQYITYVGFDKDYLTGLWQKENELGRLNGDPCARTDLSETKFSIATSWPSGWAKEISDGFAMAQPEPWCPHWNDLKNEIVKPLQDIYLTENMTRDQAAKELMDCAQTLCTKYPDTFKMP